MGFLEEEGRRGRTAAGAPGGGGISKESLGHQDCPGWLGRFGLCLQARRPRLHRAERRTFLSANQPAGAKRDTRARPRPGRWAGPHLPPSLGLSPLCTWPR